MVNSDWLGLNLDYASFREKDPYLEIEQSIKHAVTWQIKETLWINGKETPVDLVRLFDIMKKSGYRGYLPIETQGEEDPFEKIPKWLDAVQKVLSRY
jgi:hypothetical protein